MAREKEEKKALEEKPREFGEGEAIERTQVNPQDTDIFDEFLKGKNKEKAAKVRQAIDKNDEDLPDNEDIEMEEDDEQEDEEDSKSKIVETEQEPSEEEKPKRQRKPRKKAAPKVDAKSEGFSNKAHDDESEGIKLKGKDPAQISKEQEEDTLDSEEKIGEEAEVSQKIEEETEGEEILGDDEPGEWTDEEFDYDIDHDAKEPEELTKPIVPTREEIKKTVLAKASMASGGVDEIDLAAEKLQFLSDPQKKSVFIGRKASIYKKYGFEAALQLGKVQEKDLEGWDVYLDSLNPHVVFVCGARGSGKCLTGDTLITLDSGEVVPIRELENRNEKIFAVDNKLKITSAIRTGFYKRTVSKILKIKMQSGKEIELTPEHPLLTINGWKPAEEFSRGDRIATPRILPAFGNTKMKECDVKLLAYLIAEGHLDNQFVLFSNMNEKINSEFKESVLQFDPNLRVELHSKEGCFRVAQIKKKVDLSHIVRDSTTGRFTDKGYILMERSSIRKWLESIGLYGKLAGEKFIPKEIMKLEKGQLALFLNRLFSCDGSIYRINKGKSWAVSIGFTSKKLTQQVQHLIARYGVISTFRNKINRQHGRDIPNYEVVLYGENVIKYIQEIGFFGYKEERAAIALEEMAAQIRNPNLDTIPIEVWNKFQVRNWKQMARELGYAPQSFHNTRNYSPSREKLAKMARIEGNSGIEMLAQSDIYWDIIKEITEINQETEVYDITVPELHNFVANDIIVHNSYVLGVIAEELADKNKNVGIIVVDPIGVFWSMRFANKDEKELEKLKEYGLEAKGLSGLKVFIPEGMKDQVPKSTYDAGFAIQPSLLTGEDWALTFGVDRFSVSGLLLDKVLKKVETGYKKTTTEESAKPGEKVKPKGKKYALEDLIECLETDSELNSRDKGYKQDSIRAIISRFEAAKSWGIFHEKGTPLGELSREGQMTILDTSFLEDNVTALVIGILARRLLSARKIGTRKEAANKFKSLNMNELLELEVPPTWLFIDEAHTLIPSGNEMTAATAGLIEYVKQGRRPGLSLVFATQQPSAINTKVLSQLDVIMTHKLIFDDDIKAVFKRTPTIIPRKYRNPNFIKTLPVGVAVTGDRREETSRAFVMGIRPRKSQHEGRDAETTGLSEQVDSAQAQKIAFEMLLKNVKEEKRIDMDKAKLAVETLNAKYRTHVDFEKLLKELEAKGLEVSESSIAVAGFAAMAQEEEAEDEVLDEEQTQEQQALGLDREELVPLKRGEESEDGQEGTDAKTNPLELDLLSLPQRINEQDARRVVEGVRKKAFFGILGNAERIEWIKLRHYPIWRIKFDAPTRRGEFISRECFVNSLSGEFVHFKDGQFIESKGLVQINDLGDEEAMTLKLLQKREMLLEEIMAQTQMDEARLRRVLQKLVDRALVAKTQKNAREIFSLKEKLDLPPSERHELLGSLSTLPFVRTEALSIEREKYSREDITKALRKLWGSILVKKIEPLYKPIWHVVLSEDAKERTVIIDAVNGKIISEKANTTT